MQAVTELQAGKALWMCLLLSVTSVWNNNVHLSKITAFKAAFYSGHGSFWQTMQHMSVLQNHQPKVLCREENTWNCRARFAANREENNTLWHVSHQCAPDLRKSCCMVSFSSVPNARTSRLCFTPTETSAVNRTPIRSSGTIQCLERLALSSSSANRSLAAARMHTGRGQSCHFRGHCQISASTAWCGSAPYNHPDVSNQLGFSYPPHPLLAPSECVLPSTAGNISWNVNVRIWLNETCADIWGDKLPPPPHVAYHLNSWHILISFERIKKY